MGRLMLLLLANGCFLLSERDLQDRLAPAGDSGQPDSGNPDDSTDSESTDSADDTGGPDSGDTGGPRLFYEDLDGDQSGNPDISTEAKIAPLGFVDNRWDCDDNDDSEPVWVAGDAGSLGDGSFDQPLTTISAGALKSVKCVRVRPGTYEENVRLGGHNLDIEGVEGATNTTIKANVRGSTIEIAGGEHARLSGLTITGGTGSTTGSFPYGGGIYLINPAELVAENLVISGNSATNGGGIYSSSPNLKLTDIQITENDAYAGGAFLQEGGWTEGLRVTISENTGTYAAAGYQSNGVTTLTNSIVDANRGSDGMDGIYVISGSLALINCTLFDHDTAVSADGRDGNQSDIWIQNTIVGGGEFGLVGYEENEFDVRYSWFFDHFTANWYPPESDPTGTAGNVAGNPGLEDATDDGDAANDDLHLSAGSPAIDAGDPSILDADNSTSDVGAYGGPDAEP